MTKMEHPQRGAVLLVVMLLMVVLMLIAAGLSNYFLTSEDQAVENLLIDVRTYWAQMGHVYYVLSRTGGQGVCGSLDNSTNNQKYYCGTTSTSAPTDDDSNGTCDSSGSCGKISSESTAYAKSDVFTNSYTPLSFTGRPSNNNTPASSLQKYSVELDTLDKLASSSAPTVIDPGSRRWTFPQDNTYGESNVTTDYYITLRSVVRDRRMTDQNGAFASPPSYPADITSSAPQKHPQLRMDISVIDSGTMVSSLGPSINGLKDRADRLTIGFGVTDSYLSDPGTNTYTNRGCNTPSNVTSSYEGQVCIEFIMRNADLPLTNYMTQ